MNPQIDIVSKQFDLSNLPPSFFDNEAALSSMSEPAGVSLPELHESLATEEVTRKAIRIARAVSGSDEVRLVEQVHGNKTVYLLEKTVLQPYQQDATPMMRGNGKPMPLKQAEAAYQKEVALAYPAETLRNGRTVARHVDLL